jgi:hypothetical protein
MQTYKLSVAVAGALLVVGVTSVGCVADRPARNGVFNENQYVRKDFIIQGVDPNGDTAGTDPGWLMRATVTETSTPNLLGTDAFGIFGGAQSDVQLVRFRVTSDKLQLLSMIQQSAPVNTTGNNGTTAANNTGVTEDVVNSWPATNVDLKYRVNLDGETTNFYEENQELDWQVRQWVKLQFDKNDFSDLQPLGSVTTELVGKCADAADISATLVPDSFLLDGAGDSDISNDYMEFTVQVVLPLDFSDATCQTAYGAMMADDYIGRTSVVVNLKYSFKRATPVAQLTYQPWVMGEKDPIRTKYGPFLYTVYDRDNTSSLLAANQYVGRFDPAKPIVWYFDESFPENYKSIFRNPTNPADPTTIQGATNALLNQAHAVNPSTTAQVSFKEYDDGGSPRQFGDIRYNFLRWVSDQDSQDTFAGVTMPGFDPRTGEIVNEGIVFNDFAVLNYYVERIDAFLTTIGASQGLSANWSTNLGSCTVGQTVPLVDSTVLAVHNASSTLFTKMQTYLNLNGPDPSNNHLGPADFAAVTNETDPDFISAYMTSVPYVVFADPALNPFVTPEGQAGVYGPASVSTVLQALQDETTFQQTAAVINSGQTPYAQDDSVGGVANAAAFVDQMRDASHAHMQTNRVLSNARHNLHMDVPGSFSLETVMEQDSRQCVAGPNGTPQWETKDQWIQHIIDTYWQQVLWHEFGHSLGLEHNFMASVDQANFTTQRDSSGKLVTDGSGHTLYDMYSSSVMEYNAAPARLAWTQGWGNYDKGAITWIYANNGPKPVNASEAKKVPTNSRSGQADATYPYNDPNGFCAASDPDCTASAERQYLRCDENHLKYTPLCREGDMGTTPSEIIANDIDMYEWEYQWRNFRNYLKVWNVSNYANEVSAPILDLKRFMPQWYFDWNPNNLTAFFKRVGVVAPPGSDGAGNVSAQDYYTQLVQKFQTELATTASMMAAFDEAIIAQAQGERPVATVFDKFYGDETQQGIILDKYFAMQDFIGMWPTDNYNPNDEGTYLSSWASFDFNAGALQQGPGASYQSVAETAVNFMTGTQYNAFAYFIPTAVSLFAQDTHSPSFLDGTGRTEAKDWIGGQVFTREEDLINYFRTIALNACAYATAPCLPNCTTFESCTYDVTDPTQVAQSPTNGQFVGPDLLSYMYAYLPSRNEWVLARQDRNVTLWRLIGNYNNDIMASKDDGTADFLYSLEYQIKYTIDAYEAYEQGNLTVDNSGATTTASN